MQLKEAVTWRCSVKKLFLEILQNSNTFSYRTPLVADSKLKRPLIRFDISYYSSISFKTKNVCKQLSILRNVKSVISTEIWLLRTSWLILPIAHASLDLKIYILRFLPNFFDEEPWWGSFVFICWLFFQKVKVSCCEQRPYKRQLHFPSLLKITWPGVVLKCRLWI